MLHFRHHLKTNVQFNQKKNSWMIKRREDEKNHKKPSCIIFFLTHCFLKCFIMGKQIYFPSVILLIIDFLYLLSSVRE